MDHIARWTQQWLDAVHFADPLPLTADTGPAAPAHDLRVASLALLRATGRALDLRELERLLRMQALTIAGRASQTLVNALRPALADGSVVRVGRGRYADATPTPSAL